MNPMKTIKTPNPYQASVHIFRQFRLLQQFPEGSEARKGVCRGLCLAYAGLIKIGSNLGHAAGRGSDDQGKYENALASYTAKMQLDINVGNASNPFEALIEGTRHNALQVSMHVLDTDCEELAWICLDKIAQVVTTPSNVGKFFQIMLPNHAVCGAGTQEYAYLFDPNFGQVKSPRANYVGVLRHVLGYPLVQAKYELKPGVPVYLIATG